MADPPDAWRPVEADSLTPAADRSRGCSPYRGGSEILRYVVPRVVSETTIGRESTLQTLERLLTSAADGSPALAMLGGEAEIGKSRVTEELEDRAREAGFHVLHGECIEFGGEELPYAPILAALNDLPDDLTSTAIESLPAESQQELGALLPRLSPIGSAGERNWSSRFGQGRLYELILALTRQVAPVLIVFEDMHWADRSSRDFLSFFARNARSGSLLLVATYRTDELNRTHPLHPL